MTTETEPVKPDFATERSLTEGRIAALQQENAQAREFLVANEAAINQMQGRLRLLRELLGEVEPFGSAEAVG